jgi:DNA transformation protein
MGEKDKKLSQESVLTTDLLMERLSQIGGITIKKMFGGHGIFHEGKMFGIIDSKGQSYLKADDSNRADFEAFGSYKHSRMPYLSIPEKVLNDPEVLVIWARKSIGISK